MSSHWIICCFLHMLCMMVHSASRQVIPLKVTVVTSTVTNAETDSTVFMTLHGESGDCGKFNLDTEIDDLEKGAHGHYTFRCPDIGEVTSITIEHVGDDGWRPDYIKVEHDDGRSTDYCFFNSNFENTVVTKKCTNKVLLLKVTTVTSTLGNSETDSTIFMKLHGESGDCGKFNLDTEIDDFEKGAHGHYTFTCPDIGEVTSISIEHVGDDGWRPDYIKLEHVEGGSTKYCYFDRNFENTVVTKRCH